MISKDRVMGLLTGNRALALAIVVATFLCSVSLPTGVTIWLLGLGFGLIAKTAIASSAFILIFAGLWVTFEFLIIAVGRA